MVMVHNGSRLTVLSNTVLVIMACVNNTVGTGSKMTTKQRLFFTNKDNNKPYFTLSGSCTPVNNS